MASLVGGTERSDETPASASDRSPGSPNSPRPVLATMTPVPVQDFSFCHKVEIDSNDGYPSQEVIYADKNIPSEMYSGEKGTTIMYQHSPGDMLTYDSEKTLSGEMYDQDMGAIDEKAPIDLIYEDGKQTVIYTTTPDQKRVEMISGHAGSAVLGSSPLDVSVVVHGQPGPTVLVLADHMLDDMGQVIGIQRYVHI